LEQVEERRGKGRGAIRRRGAERWIGRVREQLVVELVLVDVVDREWIGEHAGRGQADGDDR
jgi:hypothetical protein